MQMEENKQQLARMKSESPSDPEGPEVSQDPSVNPPNDIIQRNASRLEARRLELGQKSREELIEGILTMRRLISEALQLIQQQNEMRRMLRRMRRPLLESRSRRRDPKKDRHHG